MIDMSELNSDVRQQLSSYNGGNNPTVVRLAHHEEHGVKAGVTILKNSITILWRQPLARHPKRATPTSKKTNQQNIKSYSNKHSNNNRKVSIMFNKFKITKYRRQTVPGNEGGRIISSWKWSSK